MDFVLPPREGSAPRSAPRPQFPPVPSVTRDEVGLAIKLVTGMYEPLEPHAEALLAFALESRQSAHAIVQIAWVIAKIELTEGSTAWYHKDWLPAMAQAKRGEKMGKRTPEGRAIRLCRGERDVLIATIAPVFNAPAHNDEAKEAVARAVIGRFGHATRTSLRIIELVAGEEGYAAFKAELGVARRKDDAVIADGTAKLDVEESGEDATAQSEQAAG
ncbi:hypothetical protein HY631_00430 [Candidatus Uhrbacteria bacterium]|nr:hypothetical protein [Candidatus Uhrbacteria bacterium]